jgi:RHS repeat-associated protein
VAASYVYGSFGKLTASTGTVTNPFQYTGRGSDAETGLYYHRARYFDQNVGRFLSEDPIGFGEGPNFYQYTRNNPLKYVDPWGLTCSCTYQQSSGLMMCADDRTSKVVVICVFSTSETYLV